MKSISEEPAVAAAFEFLDCGTRDGNRRRAIMKQPSKKLAALSPEVDRRRSERLPFTATSEIVELRTSLRILGRVADIGRGGCYVDVINPFPADTVVRIRIKHGNKAFQAKGTVVFSLEGMGMGIAFTDISEDQVTVLEEWLGIRQANTPATADDLSEITPFATPQDRVQRDVLIRLINFLLRQKTITTTQAESLLSDLMAEN